MTIQTRAIDYSHDGTALEGLLVHDDQHRGARPTVLVAHQWDGRSAFVEERAHALAKAGYTAFALDMYGKGVRGSSTEENLKLMTPLMENRARLAARMQAGLATARAQKDAVDTDRVAAIGYCFGGLCVLDLARSGASVRGVASFHGLLKSNGLTNEKPLTAKVMALHGADDPMAPIDDVAAFKDEMTAAGADWQLHMYGHAKHAFAVPGADNAQLGLKHNASAERRSWKSMLDFLAEVLI